MAPNNVNEPLGSQGLQLDTRGALEDIGFNSLLDAGQAPPSDDEGTQANTGEFEEVQSAIGVSISREQARLTSPTTPAVEKVAAIEKTGYCFGGFDGTEDALVAEAAEEEEEDDDDDDEDEISNARPDGISPKQTTDFVRPARSISESQVPLPSPWRVDQKVYWETNDSPRTGLFDTLFNRKRASTGGQSAFDGLQKSFLASLPSLPKSFSMGSPFSNAPNSKDGVETEVPSTAAPSIDTSNQGIVPDIALISGDTTRRGSSCAPRSKSPLLRRSTSDQSLTAHRTLSRVESLGDDTRFLDVHDQVNSRFKAIKDSWQDANFKIPGGPTFRVSSLTADSLRGRVGSLSKKQNDRSLSIADMPTNSSRHSRPIDPMTRRPYSDVRTAINDTTSGKTATHPQFYQALGQLEGDVIVLGGYRGSILRSAEPPHRQVWVPVKVGLNLRKVNLEVGIEEDGDERATERVIPDGMLTHIGPVDISRRLFKRLRACENAKSGKLRVWDYGYDWRLTPSYLSTRLIQFLENLPCNQSGVEKPRRGATVIAHSLGGLITRHAVNQRPDLFAGVVYAGVPQTCVNILGPLRNGDEVLISDRVLTAQVNFSIRTSFALLPINGQCFFDRETGEEYPVDFFDANTWDELRLSPCVNRPLPPLQPPPRPTGISGYVSSVASMLPSMPLRNRKDSGRPNDSTKTTTAGGAAAVNLPSSEDVSAERAEKDENIRTAVTISREDALKYLERTLASVKKFKQELAFIPELANSNRYPPIAVIYGKSTPTVYGARVNGREGIKHADAYDDLAFASGDGVVLARAAMVPEGYKAARGGIVASDRGHVTLLGDLEAVGRCLNAVIRSRRKGYGCG